jgi:sec-independent protein translocase protein TatA
MFRNPTVDILVILFIVLLIFGPKRLPLLGKELGRGIREFKDSITTSSKDADAAEAAELTQTTTGAPGSNAGAPPAASAAPGERPAASRTERGS